MRASRACDAMPAKKAPKKGAATRKAAAKKAAPRKPSAKKTAARKAPAKKSAKAPAKKPFGRPGTAGKAEGDAPVRAWIRSVKPEHREIVQRIDALVGEIVPDVKRSIKWSTPLYGRAGIGQFASMASFKEHVRLSFFAGANLTPVPPEGSSELMRGTSLRSMADFDEARIRSWIEQASKIRGWGKA